MDAETWDKLSPAERREQVDLSNLTAQLIGLEQHRVEVVDLDGNTRRFNVGRSTGWRPCHLEIHNRRSLGGIPADKAYRSVRIIYRLYANSPYLTTR